MKLNRNFTAFAGVLALVFAGSLFVPSSFAAHEKGKMKMMKPKTVTLRGTVIDITCASKGKALMGKWVNAKNDDHKTPHGPMASCATMCLRGGQPAGLFANNHIKATFACNPQKTLSKYAAKEVEVKGFWAGDPKDASRTFVPVKIRLAGTSAWEDVDCATMH